MEVTGRKQIPNRLRACSLQAGSTLVMWVDILLQDGWYSPFLLLSYNLFNVDCLYGLLSYDIHRHGLIASLGEVDVV